MNGHVSQRRLASAAMCFALLAVVGIVYSAPPSESDCNANDSVIADVEGMMEDCEKHNMCDALEELYNDLACQADACWNADGGFCEAS